MRYLEFNMYNRLFTKILDSSIWLEPTTTRIVWITLLAAMDEDGYAHFSAIENLAARARVTKEEAQAAVDCFLAPDPNSENTEHEGRRVERVPGGYFVLNAEHHRKILNREIRREQTRLRVAKSRAKKKGNKESVTSALPSVTPASEYEVTSERIGESERKGRCTQKEAEDFCASIGLPRSDGTAMFLHWEERGWAKVRDWKLTIRKWQSFGYLPSQKAKPKGEYGKPPPPPRRIDQEYEEFMARKAKQ